MRPELQESLIAVEPGWFGREWEAMARGFEVGDGWEPLVRGLLEAAAQRRTAWKGAGDNPFAPPTFRVTQVKEKFGGLRFYYMGADEAFRAEALAAEARSFSVCEECGEPGRVGKTARGWRRTLCQEHSSPAAFS